MKTVSDVLKAAREKKGVDLRTLSDILKIREKYLVALENGDYSLFPSSANIRGFLRNYANFLELDVEEILALYRRENVNEGEKFKQKLYSPPSIQSIKFTLKPGYIVSAFIIITVVSILGYLFYQFKTYSAPPRLDITVPLDNQVVNSPKINLKGTTDPGDTLTINGEQLNINPDGSFFTELTLHTGVNKFEIKALNSLNKINVVERTVIYDLSNSPTTTSSKFPIQGKVSIDKSGSDTWVQIIVDGNIVPFFQGIIHAGESKDIQAQKEISIISGNASETSFSVNGSNIPLKNGKVKIKLSQSGDITLE